MRIAVVSDTHLPRFGRSLPKALVEGFAHHRIERILHAGDWTEPLAVDLLQAIAPVDGVAGNNDGEALHERFGTRRTITVDGVTIGITHGHLGPGRTTQERAVRAFQRGPDSPQVIVFGHSHVPSIRHLGSGRWLVNPGSPTDKRRQPSYTWALLEVQGGVVLRAELVTYPSRRS